MNKVGSLYLVKKLYWVMFSEMGLAKGSRRVADREDALVMVGIERRWNDSCQINLLEENSCFVLLEKNEDCLKVLDTKGNIGWINIEGVGNFAEFFEKMA